jgi:hypothetical protein
VSQPRRETNSWRIIGMPAPPNAVAEIMAKIVNNRSSVTSLRGAAMVVNEEGLLQPG